MDKLLSSGQCREGQAGCMYLFSMVAGVIRAEVVVLARSAGMLVILLVACNKIGIVCEIVSESFWYFGYHQGVQKQN